MPAPGARVMSGKVHISRPTVGVLLLEIDNPPANVLTTEVLAVLRRTLSETEADDLLRVIVFSACGRAFSGGADLKLLGRDVAGPDHGEATSDFLMLLEEIATRRIPTIAAINGHCVGGGLELALCCDVRLASVSATFVCAGVNVGLMASACRLPRLIGTSRAKAMLLTGLAYSASTAECWGLVTELHEPDELLPGALRLADRIATRAPLSVEATKRIADRAMNLSPREALELEAVELGLLLSTRDHREAVAAFLEKRTPVFRRA